MQNSLYTPLWIQTLANHQADPDHTVGMLKAEVYEQCGKMIRDGGFDWHEFWTRRSSKLAMVKACVCNHAFHCLNDYMDEREIAEMIGLKLTGFKMARYRWREQHGASITG